MRLLLLLLFLSGCESKPRFELGAYLKHVQSGCIGIVDSHLEARGSYLVRDYICRIEEKNNTKLIKVDIIEIHETLLYPVGLTIDDNSVSQYIEDMYYVLKKDQEEK